MGQSGDDAGVNTAGEEGTHFHVTDLVGLHRLGDHLSNLLGVLFQALGVGLKGEGVIGAHVQLAVPVGEVMAGKQTEHALKEGLIQSGILEGEVELQCLPVQLLFEVGVGEKALELRAEEEGVPHGGVVEGLDAEGVTSAVQGLGLGVPYDKGEHATQLPGDLSAPLHVAVEHHLGVRGGLEGVAQLLELGAQGLEVINFSVIGQNITPVGAGHGLVAVSQVNDGQAAVGDGAVVIGIVALLVGATVNNGIAHGVKGSDIRGRAGEKSGKTAHRVILQKCFENSD